MFKRLAIKSTIGFLALGIFGVATPAASADEVMTDIASRSDASAPAGGAGHQNGVCDAGEFCLFYNSSVLGYGSVSDFYWDDPDLSNNYFISPGAGQGQVVANNAAAYRNNDPELTVYVYVGRTYSGRWGYIPPMRVRNFSSGFKNNVESFYFTAID